MSNKFIRYTKARHDPGYPVLISILFIYIYTETYISIHTYARTHNNVLYIKSIKLGQVPFEVEVLTKENKINEYVFTTLRTSMGCNLAKVKEDFDFDVLATHSKYIENLVTNNLVVIDNHVLKLTFKGKLLADQIALDLMVS